MKSTKFIFLTLLLAFSGINIQAQQRINLSVRSAIEIMLEKNFDLQIMRKNVESSELDNTLGIAGFFPSVDIGAEQDIRYNNETAIVTTNSRDESIGRNLSPYIQLNWTLFNGFAAHIRKDKFALIEDLSEGNVVLLVENNIQAVVLAYYQVLLNDEKLQTIATVKKLSKEHYDSLSSVSIEENDLSYAVLQAQNAFLRDSTSYLLQQLETQKTRLNLNLILGVEKSARFDLTDKFTAIEANYDYDLVESKMLIDNKTLINQYINLEILKKKTAFSRTPLYPTLRLNSGSDFNNTMLLYQGMTKDRSYSYDYYANFSLSFNLFNGGNTRVAIKNARIQEDIGQIQIDQIIQSLTNELVTILDIYKIQKRVLQIANLSFEKAKLNMDLSTKYFRNGNINTYNFRDIQSDYINADFNRLEAVYDLLDTNTEILRMSGGIISELE